MRRAAPMTLPHCRAPLAALGALGALTLAGCIVVPRSAEVYDPKCRTYVKQIVLETEALGAIGGCRNDGCTALLAAMGIVSAASAVVSGSVAVVGNIAYWVERRGQCPTGPADGQAVPVVPVVPVVPGAPAASGASAPAPRPAVVPGLVPSQAT